MAKAVAVRGLINVHEVHDVTCKDMNINLLESFYQFIDEYRTHPNRLSSFIVPFHINSDFEEFEIFFWKLLRQLNQLDKKHFSHDPRVSSDPASPEFSFSIKEEAFFILALHPESPRFARRFRVPAIVFNPHQQFESLRKKGLYSRVRDVIRFRDKVLQGFINPMVKDFGEKSEIFQYIGRTYAKNAQIPFNQEA